MAGGACVVLALTSSLFLPSPASSMLVSGELLGVFFWGGGVSRCQMSSTLLTFATSQRAADERESELKAARRTLEERLSTVEAEKVLW